MFTTLLLLLGFRLGFGFGFGFWFWQLHDGNTAYSALAEEKTLLQKQLHRAEEDNLQVVAGVTKQLKAQKHGTQTELGNMKQQMVQKDKQLADSALKLTELLAKEKQVRVHACASVCVCVLCVTN